MQSASVGIRDTKMHLSKYIKKAAVILVIPQLRL